MRKVAQPLPVVSNGKRQRIVSPAAAKVIDEEDEPRTSPSMRKASLQGERTILSGIENV